MEMTVTKTQTEKIEIELPYYLCDSCHAYMIFSDANCLQVCHGMVSHYGIITANASLPFQVGNSKKCTKEEFIELYNKVQEYLNSIITK